MQFRQDRMTSEERLNALFNRQPVDRVPFFLFGLGFNAVNVGYQIAEYYNNPLKSFHAAKWTIEQYNCEELPILSFASFGVSEFGGEIKWPDSDFSQAPSATRHPVETEEDVWNLKIPEIRTAGVLPIFFEFAKLFEKVGYRYYSIAPDEVFIGAGNLCGLEKLCRWIIKKPEVVHHLLRIVMDFKIKTGWYLAKTFDKKKLIPWLGDPTSSNAIITPKIFEEFVFPYSKELHEKLLDMGFKHIITHICGEQNKNYPNWAQIPMGEPGIVSVSPEVDLEKAIDYFPDDIIMGNIDPVIIQTGSPAEVYEQTKICIEKGKKAKLGFILAPGCELPPKAPPYNVWTIRKAIDDFGWYD